MSAILLKILTALPWSTIIKFVFGLFKDKDEKVIIGEDTSKTIPVKSKSIFSVMSSKLWMIKARSEVGVKEVPGRGNNKQILRYHASTTLKASEDLVPWCSSFVCWVLEKAGIPSTRSARARSYEEWGTISEKKPGAIVVLWRGDRDGRKGHVGFYVGDDENRPGYIRILGGNQSNAVNVSSYPEDRVLSYRWPLDD